MNFHVHQATSLQRVLPELWQSSEQISRCLYEYYWFFSALQPEIKLLELQIKRVKEKQVQGQVLTHCWMSATTSCKSELHTKNLAHSEGMCSILKSIHLAILDVMFSVWRNVSANGKKWLVTIKQVWKRVTANTGNDKALQT